MKPIIAAIAIAITAPAFAQSYSSSCASRYNSRGGATVCNDTYTPPQKPLLSQKSGGGVAIWNVPGPESRPITTTTTTSWGSR